MPEKATMARARRAKRQGKAPSTQAGEFVREEIHHVREGPHPLPWDIGFLVLGAMLLVGGWLLQRAGRSREPEAGS